MKLSRLLGLVVIGALMQVSPAPLPRYFRLDSGRLREASVPAAGADPFLPVLAADLNADRQPEELRFGAGKVSIVSDGTIVWQSPAEWTVTAAAITDLDHDTMPEVTLLLWRPFRPWPVDRWLPHGGRIAGFQDAGGNSCHFILIGWRGGAYRERWAGSALAQPVTAFAAADLDADGDQELITLESTYTAPRSAPARRLKIWEWNGFGFTVVTAVEGVFHALTLVRAGDGRILIRVL